MKGSSAAGIALLGNYIFGNMKMNVAPIGNMTTLRGRRGKMTDREKLCKEFTELTGGHWHDKTFPECGVTNRYYTNPADVLKVMMKRADFGDFMVIKIHNIHPQMLKLLHGSSRVGLQEEIPITYITEPDKLLQLAVEWLKEKGK
jgi:hypothetical protein